MFYETGKEMINRLVELFKLGHTVNGAGGFN